MPNSKCVSIGELCLITLDYGKLLRPPGRPATCADGAFLSIMKFIWVSPTYLKHEPCLSVCLYVCVCLTMNMYCCICQKFLRHYKIYKCLTMKSLCELETQIMNRIHNVPLERMETTHEPTSSMATAPTWQQSGVLSCVTVEVGLCDNRFIVIIFLS